MDSKWVGSKGKKNLPIFSVLRHNISLWYTCDVKISPCVIFGIWDSPPSGAV